MKLNCPSCSNGILKPTKLEPGLPALSCGKCSGVLISMLSYRAWLEESSYQNINPAKTSIEVDDTEHAMACPKCRNFMTKYRVSDKGINRLDSCGSCGELWIDSGEWELLASLNLTKSISSILSQPWQKQIALREADKKNEQKVLGVLGEQDYLKVKDLKGWLSSHPEKEVIMRYLLRKNH
ncbi:MAG: zf-TFIIB domain-containing protein [Candidatus Thiodiazotropha sp. (ex Monitilora ramsayi)]|nr:zf-TFIIB domain-containing protein [Candidatus Thiodiazotropha sp. (ex Monitilora ramsayi)]